MTAGSVRGATDRIGGFDAGFDDGMKRGAIVRVGSLAPTCGAAATGGAAERAGVSSSQSRSRSSVFVGDESEGMRIPLTAAPSEWSGSRLLLNPPVRKGTEKVGAQNCSSVTVFRSHLTFFRCRVRSCARPGSACQRSRRAERSPRLRRVAPRSAALPRVLRRVAAFCACPESARIQVAGRAPSRWRADSA